MIKTANEYEAMKKRLQEEAAGLEVQRQRMVEAGLPAEHLDLAMSPMMSFYEQLREEVENYERIMRKDFSQLSNLTSIGRLLIALRISQNLKIKDLAERLDISSSQVSRDERDEYHGASIEKVNAVLKALGVRIAGFSIEEIDHKAAKA